LRTFVAATLASACVVVAPASAQDATWLATPGTAVYRTPANWSTGALPGGTASFGASTQSALTMSSTTSVGGWTFNADAVAYSFYVNGILNFTGAGIAVNGGSVTLNNPGEVYFKNASSAGSATINNASGSLSFQGTSTAANAIIDNGVTASFSGSSSAGSATITSSNSLIFSGSSTADSATITVSSGTLSFGQTSTAGNASITNNGQITLSDNASGGSASIVNNSLIFTLGSGSGGNAAFTNGATGYIDFSSFTSAAGDHPNTMGSLAGAGAVFLGSNRVTVGGNNLSTAFTGVISDCGVSGDCYAFGFGHSTGGSLMKTGTGTLTLAGVNTYTGGTTILGGALSVNGSIANSSLTYVAASGTLGGNGTVGSTLIDGGTLAPGNSIGTLGIAGNLAFSAASRYMVEVSPDNADRVNVTGTASLGGATVNASFASGSYITKQYTILNATGGVIGTFGPQVNTNLPANFTSKLSYDAKNAYLA
jgi:autotransporter-associated beta strand protein